MCNILYAKIRQEHLAHTYLEVTSAKCLATTTFSSSACNILRARTPCTHLHYLDATPSMRNMFFMPGFKVREDLSITHWPWSNTCPVSGHCHRHTPRLCVTHTPCQGERGLPCTRSLAKGSVGKTPPCPLQQKIDQCKQAWRSIFCINCDSFQREKRKFILYSSSPWKPGSSEHHTEMS